MSLIKRYIVLIPFLFLIFFLILFTFRDYGVPWDEKVFFNGGKFYLKQLLHFFNLESNLDTSWFEKNIVPYPYHEITHGVVFDMLTVFVGLPFRNFNFETLHLIRALFALPIFFLLYLIVSKLTSKVYGLIAIIFLLLFPRFYPEIFYNAVDIPTTILFTICLAYFIYYVDTKQTFLKSILFGLILGITINQRLLLFYLPLVNFVFLILLSLRGAKRRGNLKSPEIASLHKSSLAMTLLNQFVIFLSTLFFLHLTHPYLLTHPIKGLFEIISHTRQYPWNAAVLFEGQFYQAGVKPLPWYYLPKTMFITIPLTTLFLFFVGNLSLLYKVVRGRTSEVEERSRVRLGERRKTSEVKIRWQKTFYLYLLSIFYVPFLLIFLLRPTLYDSWRQFLFLSIPMIVTAAYGLNWLINFRLGATQKSKLKNQNYNLKLKNYFFFNFELLASVLRFALCVLILVNILKTTITMIQLHPYQYLYYNSLVDGLKGAYGKYETDYWGLGYKEAVLWFNKNINDPKKQYKIFVEGDPLSSSYYFKPNMQLTTNISDADYIFTFTRWNFHLRHPGDTIYTVKREGVPLIFIKKL